MRLRTWLLSLLLLALAAPLAAASTHDFDQIVVDDEAVQAQVYETYTGADAQRLRGAIDETGDGDGTVSAADVRAWDALHHTGACGPGASQACNATLASGSRTVRVESGCGLESLQWLDVEGHGAPMVGEIDSTPKGAEGPVASTTAVERSTIVTFLFDEPITSKHTVTMRLAHRFELSDVYECALGAPTVPLLDAAPGAVVIGGSPAIDPDSIRPAALRTAYSDVDGSTIGANSPQEVAFLLQNEVSFRLADENDLGALLADVGQGVALAGGGLALGLGIAALLSAAVREKLLWVFGAVPLFTRIEKDAVLENRRRERLYAYVKDHQGSTFAELRRALDLGSGTLVHHLRVLQAQGFVKPVRDGLRSRFYMAGPKVVPDTYLTRTQTALLAAIRENPGIHQKELTRRVGLTRQSVRYHGDSLAAKGVLEVRREGRWLRYFARAAPVPG